MKQTAVDWLLENITISSVASYKGLNIDSVIEQAKQIEKEQIIDAYQNGVNILIYSKEKMDKKSEQYYNETYNK